MNVAGWSANNRPEKTNDLETVKNVQDVLTGYTGSYRSALEIGAGVGRLAREMCKSFNLVVGVDVSQALVDESQKYLAEFPSARVLKGDGLHIPVDSDKFDFVYSYVTFQHMYTLEIIRANIEEAFRVLKSGGTCRIQTVKGKSNTYEGEGGIHRSYLFEDEKDFLQLFWTRDSTHQLK